MLIGESHIGFQKSSLNVGGKLFGNLHLDFYSAKIKIFDTLGITNTNKKVKALACQDSRTKLRGVRKNKMLVMRYEERLTARWEIIDEQIP